MCWSKDAAQNAQREGIRQLFADRRQLQREIEATWQQQERQSNSQGLTQHSAQREATRQIMADRRQQQRQSNSQGLTEEERNHARYEKFVSKFYFQTVLPDKSNISATSVRSLASKHDEEHSNDDENKNADASKVAASERSTKISLSRRLSSWRRPSAKDECCICLESYNVGETICAPITTECNHVFHEGCILQWVKNHDKCPLCRVDLLKD